MPALSPIASFSAWPEADAGVFDRVMLIDVQVARGPHLQVECAMLGEQRQHVIQKADAGGDICLAGAVDVERQLDIRLGSFAVDGGGSWHRESLALEAGSYNILALAVWGSEAVTAHATPKDSGSGAWVPAATILSLQPDWLRRFGTAFTPNRGRFRGGCVRRIHRVGRR